jgi:hypothetical protein
MGRQRDADVVAVPAAAFGRTRYVLSGPPTSVRRVRLDQLRRHPADADAVAAPERADAFPDAADKRDDGQGVAGSCNILGGWHWHSRWRMGSSSSVAAVASGGADADAASPVGRILANKSRMVDDDGEDGGASSPVRGAEDEDDRWIRAILHPRETIIGTPPNDPRDDDGLGTTSSSVEDWYVDAVPPTTSSRPAAAADDGGGRGTTTTTRPRPPPPSSSSAEGGDKSPW